MGFEQTEDGVTRYVVRVRTTVPRLLRAASIHGAHGGAMPLAPGTPYLVRRRYREFASLYEVLAPAAERVSLSLPPFPKGGLLGWFSKSDPAVMRERQEVFSQILEIVSAHRALRTNPTLEQFLCPE